MKILKKLITSLTFVFSSYAFSEQICSPLLNHSLKMLGSSTEIKLCDEYQGKVILSVNTASQCMFTSQYEGLEKLYKTYKDKGLVILGFPSNDFANQEPGSSQQIASFCKINYGVSFPMFRKINVKGENADPFYKALSEQADSPPKWNFHKYLIGKNGEVIDSYASWTTPDSEKLIHAIEKAL